MTERRGEADDELPLDPDAIRAEFREWWTGREGDEQVAFEAFEEAAHRYKTPTPVNARVVAEEPTVDDWGAIQAAVSEDCPLSIVANLADGKASWVEAADRIEAYAVAAWKQRAYAATMPDVPQPDAGTWHAERLIAWMDDPQRKAAEAAFTAGNERQIAYRFEELLRPAIAAMPEGLHPATADLVLRFTQALAEKLHAAEKKYGYSDGWEADDWMDECRAKLLHHVEKGDPRDVAAYCAFLWHHKQPTSLRSETAPSGTAKVPEGWKLVPVEPTQDMMRAVELGPSNARYVYRAMLAAAPSQSGNEEEGK